MFVSRSVLLNPELGNFFSDFLLLTDMSNSYDGRFAGEDPAGNLVVTVGDTNVFKENE